MTEVYFVRHAQSVLGWKDSDRTKPLTQTGISDSEIVKIALRNVKLDYCVCSPYKRSFDTIASCAKDHDLVINTDDRLAERHGGPISTENDLYKRWQDLDYAEEGGETINKCQKRNIEALFEILTQHNNEKILIGTHGTALLSILNYFDKSMGYEYFLETFQWLPYVLRAEFNDRKLVSLIKVVVLNRGYVDNF